MILPEKTRWRVERATKAAVIIDADAYFRVAREAMLNAKEQIMLVGWDFDARITLAYEDDHPEAPTTVGDFIDWLVKRTPTLQVYILRWDKGAIKTLFRGRTLWMLTRWRFREKRIHPKLDGHHPTAASQHQKIVVIDDVLAACKNKGLVKGKTTPDGLFTLTEVECLGACANAPMVQINDDNYEDLTYDSMTAILDDLAAGRQPKIGPQIDRQTSAPEGGPTTLTEMVSENKDYRAEWGK